MGLSFWPREGAKGRTPLPSMAPKPARDSPMGFLPTFWLDVEGPGGTPRPGTMGGTTRKEPGFLNDFMKQNIPST